MMYIYLTQSNLRICKLVLEFNYDAPSPYLKHPLGRIPHHIVYHYDSQKLVLASSTPVPFVLANAKYAAAINAGVIDPADESAKPVPETLPEGEYFPEMRDFSVELVSPVTLETVDLYASSFYSGSSCKSMRLCLGSSVLPWIPSNRLLGQSCLLLLVQGFSGVKTWLHGDEFVFFNLDSLV